MLIATFGPITGWAGKTITREGEVFTLKGHGPVTAASIMEYDRQGQLVWANEGTRGWVGSIAVRDAAESKATAQAPPNAVAVGRAIYIGGHSGLGPQREGLLWVTTEYIGIQSWADDDQIAASLPMASITRVGVDGGQVAKSKVLPVVLFGVFGLAAKGSKDRAYLMAYTTTSEFATYEIDDKSPAAVRATIAPILAQVRVPFDDESPPFGLDEEVPGNGLSDAGLADQLSKLAALRSEGALSEEEFAAAKRALIDPGDRRPV